MAFKRKQDTSSGDLFKFETVGQQLTGYYLGSFDYDGEYGPTKRHLFKTKKGTKVVMGQKHLTDLLADEKPGVLVQVTYESDKKVKKGNPMKVYTLDIDDEQTLSADEIPSEIESAEEPDNYDDTEPTEVEEEEEQLDEVKTAPKPIAAAAKAPSPAARAKVNEILNRRRAAS